MPRQGAVSVLLSPPSLAKPTNNFQKTQNRILGNKIKSNLFFFFHCASTFTCSQHAMCRGLVSCSLGIRVSRANGCSRHLGSAPEQMQNHFSLYHDSAVCLLCRDILHCPVRLAANSPELHQPGGLCPSQTEPCKAAPPLGPSYLNLGPHHSSLWSKDNTLLLNQIPFHSISLNSIRQKDPC